MEQTNEKTKIRALAMKRIVFAGLLLVLVSLVILFLFRPRISVLLVNNVQIEMLSIVEQNRFKVDGQLEVIFRNMETIADDAANKISKGQSLQELDLDKRLLTNEFNHAGLINIYGRGLVGPDLQLRHFVGIRESLHGSQKIVYMPNTALGDVNAVVFSVPVVKDDRILGSLYATMDMTNLQTLFNEQSNINPDESFIINSEGTVFVRAKDQELAEQIGIRLHDWQQPEAPEDMRNLYTKIRQDKSGVERVTLPDGRQVYIACMPLDTVDNLYILNVLSMEVIQERINGVLNNATAVTGILLIILLFGYGITEMRQVKHGQEIYNLAYIDTLTGLYNKEKYKRDMLREIENKHSSLCVSILNIRGMKTINELLGVSFGHNVLRQVSEILKSQLLKQEQCYIGDGGLFCLVSWDVSKEKVESRLKELIEKIQAGDCAQGKYNIQLSAGAYWHLINKENVGEGTLSLSSVSLPAMDSFIDTDSHWPENFFTKARAALKQLKISDKGGVRFFDDNLAEKIRTEKLLENNFQQALENNEFVLYYQPKYGIKGAEPELHGAEALIRWISPEYGFLSPGRFIPLFERDGNLEILDRHVLKLACRQLRQWLDAGYKAVPVSVNISRRNIVGGNNFLAYALDVLAEYQIPINLIQLEILETDASVDSKLLIRFLQIFKSSGFSLAMDDFGSGYSSLGMFNSMPIDCLKLDKSFFDSWQPDMSERDSCLIKYMIKAAHDTGRTVVAEGIEEKFQVDLLRQYDCDMIQGYYFSKPLPAEEFANKMHKRV